MEEEEYEADDEFFDKVKVLKYKKHNKDNDELKSIGSFEV